WADVGHLGGEDVGPLLLDQGGFHSLLLGGFIGLPCLSLLLNDSLDRAVSDFHPQGVDRAVRGQWKDVDPFQPFLGRIGEDLCDPRPRDNPGHLHLDRGAEDGRRYELAVLAREEQTLAGARSPGQAASRQEKYTKRCHSNEIRSHFPNLPEWGPSSREDRPVLRCSDRAQGGCQLGADREKGLWNKDLSVRMVFGDEPEF